LRSRRRNAATPIASEPVTSKAIEAGSGTAAGANPIEKLSTTTFCEVPTGAEKVKLTTESPGVVSTTPRNPKEEFAELASTATLLSKVDPFEVVTRNETTELLAKLATSAPAAVKVLAGRLTVIPSVGEFEIGPRRYVPFDG
jgi:hypothetical protein